MDEALIVNEPNTVLLGLGLATLVATNGNSIIEVNDITGVRLAGLSLEAGEKKSDTLLKVGSKGYKGDSENPIVVSDVFARVGGMNNSQETQVAAGTMMEINTDYTIIDHTWLWRADHDIGGLVSDSKNPVDHGLVVNGDNVYGYGLFVEHTLDDLLVWNGNGGKAYFF